MPGHDRGAAAARGPGRLRNRYYISSLPTDAQVLLQGVRSHWGIGNSLHWVLDMAFWEDESRIRTGHAAHNMSILRRLVLNLLRRETTAKGSIAAKRKLASWNDSYLLRSGQIRTRLPWRNGSQHSMPAGSC